MPDFTEYGHAVRAGLATAALLLGIAHVLKPTLVEIFRQRIFELRRGMFLDRIDKVLEPDRAYRIVMDTMNGTIRYAEHVTFGRTIIGALVLRGYTYEIDIALDASSEETRKILIQYRTKIHYEIARHMLLTSPLLWALLISTLPAIAILFCLASLFSMVNATKRQITGIVSSFGRLTAVKRIESDALALLPEQAA